MRYGKLLIAAFFVLGCSVRPTTAQQIGKYVPIQAGSDADHALTAINAATDPAQKLALIDRFAAGAGQEGDYPITVNGLYVETYISLKNYDKAFEYGDKLFVLDPDSFTNAQNMVRAASEKGDVDHLISYGEKAAGIIQRFKTAPCGFRHLLAPARHLRGPKIPIQLHLLLLAFCSVPILLVLSASRAVPFCTTATAVPFYTSLRGFLPEWRAQLEKAHH